MSLGTACGTLIQTLLGETLVAHSIISPLVVFSPNSTRCKRCELKKKSVRVMEKAIEEISNFLRPKRGRAAEDSDHDCEI